MFYFLVQVKYNFKTVGKKGKFWKVITTMTVFFVIMVITRYTTFTLHQHANLHLCDWPTNTSTDVITLQKKAEQ